MGRRWPTGGLILAFALAAAVCAACSGDAASGPATGAVRTVSSMPAASYQLGRYQPLWPFAGAGEAADWQRRYQESGLQPWRLSADQTALAFDRYLGFGAIDRVTGHTIGAAEARVAVGGHDPTTSTPRATGTVAVVHLIRLGAGSNAPWEVVGTDTKDLVVAGPAYGAAVSSPITVTGRITGIDERVRVEVHQRSSADPIGTSCCVPSGGEHGRWAAKVSFRGAVDPVLTVVASSSGHTSGVEHFAVTAVRQPR